MKCVNSASFCVENLALCSPKTPKDGRSKTPWEHLYSPPRHPQDTSRTAQDAIQNTTRRTQDAPKYTQDVSRYNQDALIGFKNRSGFPLDFDFF